MAIFFVINELPPEERFKPENLIMAGLWGSHEKPHPNIFLQAVHAEVADLRKGFEVNVNGLAVSVLVKVIPLWCTAHAPAKAAFLNLKSHMGYSSCPKCLIEGEKSDETGDVMVFPHQDILPPRNEENYQVQLNTVYQMRKEKRVSKKESPSFQGVKGPTLLSYMLVFCLFKTTGIDSMHCLFLGVLKQLLILWFDTKFKDEPFTLHRKLKQVNDLLLGLQLPHFVERNFVPVDKTDFMKASVLRNLFFYALLPVMQTVMENEYFSNLVDLVKGVSLLNTDSVSAADIELSDKILTRFCKNFQMLYGKRHMSSNVHLLRHLPSCVQELGPLQIVSCFGLEGANGKLANLAHGTRHAGLQIAKHLSILSDLAGKIEKLPDGIAKTYCEQLMYKWKRFNIRDKISADLFVIGSYDSNSVYIQDIEDRLSELYSGMFHVLTFSRLYKRKLIYVTSSYSRGSRNSSVVHYMHDSQYFYGEALCFFSVYLPTHCEPDVYCYIRRAQVLPFSENIDIPHIVRCSYMNGTIDIVPVRNLETVCFRVNAKVLFFSKPLNKHELE